MGRRILLIVIGALLLPRSSTVVADRPVDAQRVPDGVSSSDWSGIRAAYEAGRHAAFAVDGGYQARNPGQQWLTRFDGRGFETTPDAGRHGDSPARAGWSWGLELVSYGRAGAERTVNGVAPANSRCGPRVEYEWDESLTEWYLNDARGLEHGYTVHRRPEHKQSPDRKGGVYSPTRGPSDSKGDRSLTACPWHEVAPLAERVKGVAAQIDAPLVITLAVRGDLSLRVSADGRGVTFVNSGGAAVVNYVGLSVFDADGAPVPARFEVASEGLRLFVNDSGARYPLTIDPIAQQAYLKASNTGMADFFGRSVAVSGDTVIVGAVGEDSSATGVNGNQNDNSATIAGAAYVFVRSAGVWSQQAYLKASNTGVADGFGQSVAVSGDTVVLGAIGEASNATGVNGNQADNSASQAGAAYVFVRTGGVWSQQAYLKASNTGTGDRFGISVAVSADTLVVGAYFEDSNAAGVDGNQSDNTAADSGAAYVFVRNGTIWSQQAYLKASNTGVEDFFGRSVSVSGDTVLVGAYQEDSNAAGVDGDQTDNSVSGSGAAYVFVRNGAIWSQQAYLKASNPGGADIFGPGDFFGFSVAVSDDTALIGAYQEDSNATGVDGNQADNNAPFSGAAYVFVRNGTSWTQQAYLKASNTGLNDRFGVSVAVSGDSLVVGADQEPSSATGVNGNQSDNSAANSGAAYVFVRSGTTWSQQAYLKASNTGTGDRFGISLAVSADTLVVAAYSEDSNAAGVDGNQSDNSALESGAAYVFVIENCSNLGDMNCDCAVDFADVDAFVQALLDPDDFAAAFPGCDILHGDIQPDGNVDGGDVQGFVDLLIP